MKLAVPIDPETGMVAEHFGHAKHIKLYDEVMGVVFTGRPQTVTRASAPFWRRRAFSACCA